MKGRGRRLAVLIVLAALALFASCRKRGPFGFLEPAPDGTHVTCPITGETCTKTPETASAVYDERTYYFCTPAAWDRFQADPGRYAD